MFTRNTLSRSISALCLGVGAASYAAASPLVSTLDDYNALGLPETLTSASGQVTKMQYNSAGQLISRKECGNACGTNDLTTSYTYEGGQIKTITYPDGMIRTYVYDSNGYMKDVKLQADGITFTESHTVNKLGWASFTTDAEGVQTQHLARDEVGRLTKVKAMSNSTEEALVTELEYDKLGNVIRSTVNPSGGAGKTYTTETQYAIVGASSIPLPIEVKVSWQKSNGNAESLRTTISYDVLGRKTSETVYSKHPETGTIDSYTTSFEYTLNSTYASIRGCDQGGCRHTTVTHVNGEKSVSYYDVMGRLMRSVSPRGVTTDYEYDGFGRLSATIAGSRATYLDTLSDELDIFGKARYLRTENTYDDDGFLTQTIQYFDNNNNGNVDATESIISEAHLTYDEFGRISVSREGDYSTGTRAVYNYDNMHRVTDTWLMTGGSGNSTVGHKSHARQQYDGFGRIKTSHVDNLTTTYTYDGMRLKQMDGPRTDVTDTTTYDYTLGGRLKSVTDGSFNVVRYEYDRLGRMVSMQRQGADAITYAYDALGRQLGETVGGNTSSTVYWPDGRIHKSIDLAGKATQYRYNNNMQLTHLDRAPLGISPSRDDATFKYDVDGNIYETKDYQVNSNGTATRYGYDALGQLIETVRAKFGSVSIRSNGTTNRLASVLHGNHSHRMYEYDRAGRLREAYLNRDNRFTFDYDALGLTQMNYPGATGVAKSITKGTAGRLDNIDITKSGSWSLQHDFAYTGTFIDEIIESGTQTIFGNRTLDLDDNNRMTSINIDGQFTDYQYGDDGRITSFPGLGVLSYDNFGWLDESAYPLDEVGNMQTFTDGSRAFSAVYDNADRLIESDDGTTKVTYAYDAAGELIRTCEGPSNGTLNCTDLLNESFLTGFARVISTHDDNNDVSHFLGTGSGEILAQNRNNQLRYFVSDHQNSIIGALSEEGAWQGARRYSPYGEIETNAIANMPLGYTGERHNADGSIYLRARHYNPQMGMFMQRDSYEGNADSPNSLQRFAYVQGNPLNYTDPSGNVPIPLVAGAAGAAITALDSWLETERQRERAENLSCDEGMMGVTDTDAIGDGLIETAVSGGLSGIGRGIKGIGRGIKRSVSRAASGASGRMLSPCCFVAGTEVQTDRGLVPIEDIQIGDLVLSEDDKTGEQAYKPVTNRFINPDKTTLSITIERVDGQRETFTVTDNHPYMTTNGWVEAGDLKANMEVELANQETATIVAIASSAEKVDTFNIEVADFHTYFVGDSQVLVHNCNITYPDVDRWAAENLTPEQLLGENGRFSVPRNPDFYVRKNLKYDGVLIGHGELQNKSFRVPEGRNVILPSNPGQKLSQHLGDAILRGKIGINEVPTRVYRPGQLAPDLALTPLKGNDLIDAAEAVRLGALSPNGPMSLSESLGHFSKGQKNICYLACSGTRSGMNHPYTHLKNSSMRSKWGYVETTDPEFRSDIIKIPPHLVDRYK